MKRLFFLIALIYFAIFAAFAQTTRPLATNIKAEAISTSQIKIKWQIPEHFANSADSDFGIAIYRATFPIITNEELNQLQPIAILSAKTTAYTDTVPAYREYFYAVLLRTSSASQFSLLIPAVNSTAIGIRPLDEVQEDEIITTTPSAKEKKFIRTDGMRNLPLPYLNLNDEQNSTNVISKETTLKVKSLTENAKQFTNIEPYSFRHEHESNLSGEKLALSDIIQNHFLQKKYTESAEALEDFLQLNREDEITARSLFYLGESYFFTGRHKMALSCFMQVQDNFPELANKWIQATLDAYSVPDFSE